jgi:hypothetical protein
MILRIRVPECGYRAAIRKDQCPARQNPQVCDAAVPPANTGNVSGSVVGIALVDILRGPRGRLEAGPA